MSGIRVISPAFEEDVPDDSSEEPIDEGNDNNEAEEEAASPAEVYALAKENTHFSQDDALEYFLLVADYEDADEPITHLKAKSVSHASILLANKADDISKLSEMFLRTHKYFIDNQLSLKKLKKTVTQILQFLFQSDEKQIEFLSSVAQEIDQTRGLSIHLDLNLRLAELYLRYGQYNEAENLIYSTGKLIPFPPDKNDNSLVQSCLNFLVMKMDVFVFRQKFSDVETSFQQLFLLINQLGLNPDKRLEMLTPANWATFLYVQGVRDLEKKDFNAAIKELYDSFTVYESVADKKRTNPIPYYWLAFILAKKNADPSSSNEFRQHLVHPNVSIMKKICQSFFLQNIPEIQKLQNGFNTVFYTALRPVYGKFFDLIIEYCVESAILNECKSYSRVSLDYLSKKIKVNRLLIEKISQNIVSNKKLSALIDDDDGILIMMRDTQKLSSFLDAIDLILPSIEKISSFT